MNKFFLLTLLFLTLLFSCQDKKEVSELEPGVSLDLAQGRKAGIEVINYDLTFDIPAKSDEAVRVKEKITIKLKEVIDVILDFKGDLNSINQVSVNGASASFETKNEHLVIGAESFKKGGNLIELQCQASDLALNCKEDYLYTLFVPDRASSAFVCFDQPDLKAKYNLTLNIPDSWTAVSGGEVTSISLNEGIKQVSFSETQELSSYLFSYAAGKFDSLTSASGLTMYHRENDEAKLARNAQEIFELHDKAISWMEEYTGIEFPFEKLDFVAIPGFQFGGMEHVGAIQYRAELLMLDESASLEKKMRRANLIVHEVSHMWFGNLVTMEWFNDVWMKEVFANFMADKVLEELFPDERHELKFLFAHYPAAYSVDRTQGTHPVRQELLNLNDASSLYGNLIYHKAPIAMKQLELIIGPSAMRQALSDYLSNHSYDNAGWDDLIKIIDRTAEQDIANWSKVWIESPGRPTVSFDYIDTPERSDYVITMKDPLNQNRIWAQKCAFIIDYEGGPVNYQLDLDQEEYVIQRKSNKERPSFIQLNSSGVGYGLFDYGVEYVKEEFIFNRGMIDISDIEDPLQRGSAYVTLHEYVLENGFHPELYLTFIKSYIKAEENDMILSYLMDVLDDVYNVFFTKEMRDQHASALETVLWNKILASDSIRTKSLVLDNYIELAQTSESLDILKSIWDGDIQAVNLSDRQKERLALNLAFKDKEEGGILLNEFIENHPSSDKKAKLQFVKEALSADSSDCLSFFEKLQDIANRNQETWVLEALYFLHHPNRSEANISMLKPSLSILEELKQTNTIFFPKRWLDITLKGYSSAEAKSIVDVFLSENEDLDIHLKRKLLQSADMLFRAEENMQFYQSL